MMEKYRLVGEKKRESTAAGAEGNKGDVCEVKITQQGKPKNYISYAMNLFVSELLLSYRNCSHKHNSKDISC